MPDEKIEGNFNDQNMKLGNKYYLIEWAVAEEINKLQRRIKQLEAEKRQLEIERNDYERWYEEIKQENQKLRIVGF